MCYGILLFVGVVLKPYPLASGISIGAKRTGEGSGAERQWEYPALPPAGKNSNNRRGREDSLTLDDCSPLSGSSGRGKSSDSSSGRLFQENFPSSSVSEEPPSYLPGISVRPSSAPAKPPHHGDPVPGTGTSGTRSPCAAAPLPPGPSSLPQPRPAAPFAHGPDPHGHLDVSHGSLGHAEQPRPPAPLLRITAPPRRLSARGGDRREGRSRAEPGEGGEEGPARPRQPPPGGREVSPGGEEGMENTPHRTVAAASQEPKPGFSAPDRSARDLRTKRL